MRVLFEIFDDVHRLTRSWNFYIIFRDKNFGRTENEFFLFLRRSAANIFETIDHGKCVYIHISNNKRDGRAFASVRKFCTDRN